MKIFLMFGHLQLQVYISHKHNVIHQEASLTFLIDLLQLTENAESRVRGLSLVFQALKLIIKAPDRLEEDDDGHDILREKRFQLGTT